ncbi:MAG: rhomboid family intramembrane serine protease [Haloferacaceae archaeon]
MADRAGLPSRELLKTYPRKIRTRIETTDWRITLYLIFFTTVAYLGQTLAAIWLNASIEGVTAYLFLNYPLVAWPLSPFLHSGNPHFLANIAMLALTGIETQRHLSDRQYIGLFLVSAVVTGLAGAATMLPFADGPVATYGISGFVFALATYLLVHLWLAHDEPVFTSEGFNFDQHPLEIVGILLGVSVVLSVATDLGQALLNGFQGMNGGHLGGAVLGIVAGIFSKMVRSCNK